MYIYNVTTQVKWIIHDDWLDWMKNEHIPEMMATELFTHFRMVKMLDIDESDGPTYAVQYFIISRDKYDLYINKFSVESRKKALEKWKEKIFSFRSLMQVV